ncbi:PREDICTED: uncharacterized protein LOC105366551 [Ceratosolen solmsi marchali]|uniref:Uncharacterized protein LOC105366551 n=1 Tax=Ceratosolen solmsi marchali TaxID=326594 RepID=A0AAJ6YSA1_9HYME|nr:PREDICTED: uncharacterized protein LOC105366551 [Ceratosolen solmsi marchali]
MWKRTRQAVINCFVLFARCRTSNSNVNGDLAEILEHLGGEMNDPPAQIGPHLLFHDTMRAEQDRPQREPFHHRPDTLWTRRRSSPEIIQKVRLALEEMHVILDNNKPSASLHIHDATQKILYLRSSLSDYNFNDNKNIEDNDDENNNDDSWYTP